MSAGMEDYLITDLRARAAAAVAATKFGKFLKYFFLFPKSSSSFASRRLHRNDIKTQSSSLLLGYSKIILFNTNGLCWWWLNQRGRGERRRWRRDLISSNKFHLSRALPVLTQRSKSGWDCGDRWKRVIRISVRRSSGYRIKILCGLVRKNENTLIRPNE